MKGLLDEIVVQPGCVNGDGGRHGTQEVVESHVAAEAQQTLLRLLRGFELGRVL